jgi:UDP-glucose 4-epimerase
MINHTEKIKNKNVLITGGLGFIGHNLSKILLTDYNCKIVIVDNCLNSTPKVIDSFKNNVTFHNISVLDTDNFFPLLKDINYIFHLACVQINHSSKDPMLDLMVNSVSILKLLEFLRYHRPSSFKRLIYTSTTSIYGSSTKLPLEENDTPFILNHYAATKLLAENYINLYNLQYDIPTAIVRYSNVYGYGQTPKNPYCGVIGKFIHNALNGETIKIFGDGEQTRDYTFITDAVRATILAAIHPRAIGDIFNIGTTCETSVNKLANLIVNYIPGIKIEHVPERDIDNIRRRSVGITKIHQRLGWIPQINIEQGIKETIEWYKLAK